MENIDDQAASESSDAKKPSVSSQHLGTKSALSAGASSAGLRLRPAKLSKVTKPLDQPHMCCTCGKEFLSAASLARHEKTKTHRDQAAAISNTGTLGLFGFSARRTGASVPQATDAADHDGLDDDDSSWKPSDHTCPMGLDGACDFYLDSSATSSGPSSPTFSPGLSLLSLSDASDSDGRPLSTYNSF
jgi:hypothetical protein